MKGNIKVTVKSKRSYYGGYNYNTGDIWELETSKGNKYVIVTGKTNKGRVAITTIYKGELKPENVLASAKNYFDAVRIIKLNEEIKSNK